MDSERNAVDVLLAVEHVQSQILLKQNAIDLLGKLNANKLKQVEDKLDYLISMLGEAPNDQGFVMESGPTPYTLATAPPMPQMHIEDEFKPPIPITTDTAPVGVRRTARPESYTDPRIKTKPTPTSSFPVPEMKPPISVVVPPSNPSAVYPLEQRLLDRNNKAIFKADVEVVDVNGITVCKTQTGILGKWSATLSSGKYRVHISKYDAATKGKLKVSQDLMVDQNTPKELPTMTIK